MKKFVRIIAFMLMLTLCAPVALAAKATPTPPPVSIDPALVSPPPEIQNVLDIAHAQWLEVDGKNIGDVNKYTEWRGKGYKFQWCAGFVTWCMMEAGIPMMTAKEFQSAARESDDGLVHKDGLFHVEEAGQGKLLNCYQLMERTTMVPQKGFVVIFGTSWNEAVHAALVYDVEDLGGGKYRITTLEGNVKNGKNNNSITMYVRDYDMNAEVNINQKKSTNLSEVPEDERVRKAGETCLQRFLNVMYNEPARRLEVFYDKDYRSLLDMQSYGHDIEASWLMWDAVEALIPESERAPYRTMCLALAEATCERAFTDHGMENEIVEGEVEHTRVWWVQAETVLGFANAHELTGDAVWMERVRQQWQYVLNVIVDPREGSEWYWSTDEDGTPTQKPVVEEWKCPYHNGRMCLRMIERA